MNSNCQILNVSSQSIIYMYGTAGTRGGGWGVEGVLDQLRIEGYIKK